MGLLGALKGAVGLGGGGAKGGAVGALATPNLATAQPGGVKPMAMPGGGGGGLAAAAPALGGAMGKRTLTSKRSMRGGRR